MKFAAPITYIPGFISDPQAVFSRLWEELAWVRHDKVPRREYYSNDYPIPYGYGKGMGFRTYEVQPWHPDMRAMQDTLQGMTGSKFEVCFLNGYEDQSDFLGYHADDSPEMDDERPIAIISLGAEREIWFKRQDHEIEYSILRDTEVESLDAIPEGDLAILKAKYGEVVKVKLESGSLCLMHTHMQERWFHRIPKAGFVCGERVSLTFRGFKP